MPTEDEELTLTYINSQIRQTKTDLQEYLDTADERITEIDDLILQIDELKKENIDYSDVVNELMTYKSSLLQIKTNIESEKKSMKSEMSKMNDISEAVGKAIKWNTGDIF